MLRNWSLCVRLVGIQNGAAAVENNIVVLKKKFKHRMTIQSSNSTSG